MNILADASLPGLEAAFPAPFQLSLYHNSAEIDLKLKGQDALLCRSTLPVNQELLGTHSLKFVATASSGTDHIDAFFLNQQGIEIIDAKGCNATSVADYVVACLAYLKQKDMLQVQKAGIIGMGKAGTAVAKGLDGLNIPWLAYDPLKDPVNFQSCSLEDLYSCDLLCIHAELHNTQPYPSTNLVDAAFLKQLKPGIIIVNAARGGIVCEEAVLQRGQNLVYCTDVYLNEPRVNPQIVEQALLCTPHIAGHSLEGKYAAVAIVSRKLHKVLGLECPEYLLPCPPEPIVWPKSGSWDEMVLSVYNPWEETLGLKQALNKEAAFLAFRKAHQKRHDFDRYGLSLLGKVP